MDTGFLASAAAAVTVLGGVVAFLRYGRAVRAHVGRWLTRLLGRGQDYLRIVELPEGSWWGSGSVGGDAAMQVVGKWSITNTRDDELSLVRVYIREPNVEGSVFTRDPDGTLFGQFALRPRTATQASTDFWIRPPIREKGQDLCVDVVFVDNLGRHHVAAGTTFKGRVPRPKKPPVSAAPVSPHAIQDPIEKDVAAVLLAEMDRYRVCGRERGGFGSVTILHRGAKREPPFPDGRLLGSTKLQAVVPDPEAGAVASEHADLLAKLHSSLAPQDRERFVEHMLSQLDRDSAYTSVAYLILLVLYRIGRLSDALRAAKERLRGAPPHGYGDFVSLLSRLLQYEHSAFTGEMLDEVEWFVDGIEEYTFQIPERAAAARTALLARRLQHVNPQVNTDRDRLAAYFNERLRDQTVPALIANIEEYFSRGGTDATSFAACIGRVRVLVTDVTKKVAERVAALTSIPYENPWENEAAVRDYLARRDVAFLSQKEKAMLKAVYDFASEEGAHQAEAAFEYARIAKNMAYEMLLLLVDKLDAQEQRSGEAEGG
ncbi:MAG TPA: hypothetical protein VMY87_00610 [Armatimonadota bacterium]|nr:hypothetical protein [Armatimonadota bacterium]